MNPYYYNIIVKAINYFWQENDIYVYMVALILFALVGGACIVYLFNAWLFDLIGEDNERTFYLSTSRQYEP